MFELNETAVFIRPLHGILQNCNPSCKRPFTITLIPRTNLVMVVADMTCPCTTTSEYERVCRTKAVYRTEPQGKEYILEQGEGSKKSFIYFKRVKADNRGKVCPLNLTQNIFYTKINFQLTLQLISKMLSIFTLT